MTRPRYGKQSLQYPQNVKIKDTNLDFPKIGEIKANLHRLFDEELKTVTISKTKTDKYYASLLFDNGQPEIKPNNNGKVLEIDLGVSSYCITSDGSKYDNPGHLKKHEHNLKRKQRKLSRKQKGSNSKNKARKLVARAHEKISNARQDFLHKLSRKLVNKSQVIVCEDLNIKGMVRNHKLAKAQGEAPKYVTQSVTSLRSRRWGGSPVLATLRRFAPISDCGWGIFLNFLEYKCKQSGKVFLQIDRFFPSSKTCNYCLNVVNARWSVPPFRRNVDALQGMPLDIRIWDCPKCLTKGIDRDINAARNCRDEGIRILSCGTRDTANGGKRDASRL